MRVRFALTTTLILMLVPGAAQAANPGGTSSSSPSKSTSSGSTEGRSAGGGTGYSTTPSTPAAPTVHGTRAKLIHGVAYAPDMAPAAVQRAIWAGNKIQTKPYIYGGGHASFTAKGYDCSGTISFALHGGGLLRSPLDSSSFASWGLGGTGKWITVFTNPGHAFVYLAGLRLDTSGSGGKGPRWRTEKRSTAGFTPRHPVGY